MINEAMGKVLDELAGYKAVELQKSAHPGFNINTGKGKVSLLKSITEAGTGGYLVPTEQSSQIIDELSAQTIAIQAGATVIPMSSDVLTIPKGAAATAYWTGEGVAAQDATPALGQVTLTAKKLTGLISVSKEMIADSAPAVEAYIRKQLTKCLALELDRAIFYGSGAGSEPTGIITLSAGNSIGVVTGVADEALAYSTLVDIRTAALAANSKCNFWAMHPNVLATIQKIEDTEGHLVLPANAPVNVLFGAPVFTSTQLTSTTYPILSGDASEILLGMREGITLTASNHSKFREGMVDILAEMRVDVAVGNRLGLVKCIVTY